jgi:hypothetical protein
MRPLIGVTTSELRPAVGAHFAHHSEPPRRMLALGLAYLEAIGAAGGIPVIVAPLPARRLESIIERLDAARISSQAATAPRRIRSSDRRSPKSTCSSWASHAPRAATGCRFSPSAAACRC